MVGGSPAFSVPEVVEAAEAAYDCKNKLNEARTAVDKSATNKISIILHLNWDK